MVKEKLELDVIKYGRYLVKCITKEGLKVSWNKKSTEMSYDAKGMEFTIEFPDFSEFTEEEAFEKVRKKELDGFIYINGNKAGIEYIKNLVVLRDNEFDQNDLNQTIFKELLYPQDTMENSVFRIGSNKLLLTEIEKEFKKIGINEVYFKLKDAITKSCYKKLAIVIQPSSSYTNNTIRTNQEFANKFSKVKGFVNFNLTTYDILPISNEECKDIKVMNNIVARYYPRRNLIISFLNPFNIVNISNLKSYTENDLVQSLFDELISELKDANIKEENTTEFELELTLEDFMKESEKKVVILNADLKKLDEDIKVYQAELTNKYERIMTISNEIKLLTGFRGEYKERIVKELASARKLKIVEDISIKNGKVEIKFIPTTCKSILSKNDGMSKFGIKEAYVGSITFIISPDGEIRVNSDANAKTGNKHPHASDSGNPCLGDGDGKNLIYQLIGERRFSDLSLMLWAWIKRVNLGHEYINFNSYVQDRLQQGYPVFDSDGTRIELNDKTRIKSGEFPELKPYENYKSNIEKFKDFKPQNN